MADALGQIPQSKQQKKNCVDLLLWKLLSKEKKQQDEYIFLFVCFRRKMRN